MKRLLILGSTGSIGTQALDVVARARDEFELVGLSAERSHEALVEQARAHGVDRIALSRRRRRRARGRGVDRRRGAGRARRASCGWSPSPTPTSCSTRSSARPAWARRSSRSAEGIDVALANKESLVVGGELVMALAEATGAQLIPVDSEHSALHQLIDGEPPGTVDRLVITASGGPFRGRTRAELEDVTVEQALKHPTWSMGGKITIDSATLMNKGLEVIEAHHLFGTPYDRSTSSCTRSRSSTRSSRCATARRSRTSATPTCACRSPTRCTTPTASTCRSDARPRRVGALTFEPPDPDAFPCLRLAREAALAGGTAPCVLNAANEVAVHAFLGDRLPFLGIPAVIERRSSASPPQRVHAFDSLYAPTPRRARSPPSWSGSLA